MTETSEVFGVPGYRVKPESSGLLLLRPNGESVVLLEGATPESMVTAIARQDNTVSNLIREMRAAYLLDDINSLLQLQVRVQDALWKLRAGVRGGLIADQIVGSTRGVRRR